MQLELAVTTTCSFKLIEVLGRGATAVAWRAQDPSGRSVLLKVGHTLATATLLGEEASHGALAISPRLPELLDAGLLELDEGRRRARSVPLGAAASKDARPFLAFTLRPGRTLDTVLDGRGRAATDALAASVAAGLGLALGELHDLGLAHGDVKPENILCDGANVGLIDLGLATDAFTRELRGGSPRYLGGGDRELGDARTRDMLALGLVLAEILDDDVRRAPHPLELARNKPLRGPIGAVARALLAPEPGARPSADWVHRLATGREASLGSNAIRLPVNSARAVRASYLRLRRGELRSADSASADAAPWLAGALRLTERARALMQLECDGGTRRGDGVVLPSRVLGPLDRERRLRWLVRLIGPTAASWPVLELDRVKEIELAHALESLEKARPPHVFTYADLEKTLREKAAPYRSDTLLTRGPPTDATIATLALAVARTPVNPEHLETIERLAPALPDALVFRAADALRLMGELGRARALVIERPGGGALAAEVLRRAGDLEHAERLARAVLESGHDPDGRARACLARLRLDAGDLAGARELVASPVSALEHEVAALAAVADADPALAHSLAERGLARATDDEARARLSATLAYVLGPRKPEAAARGFRFAAEHAVLAGAVLEEATYRTGEAAISVDRGEFSFADRAARRATLLFTEVLHRPARAARAWLARAALHAALGAAHETESAAHEAIVLARASGDTRAELYAHFAIADALPCGDPRALSAAMSARSLTGDTLDDDAVHAYARLLRHGHSSGCDAVRRVDEFLSTAHAIGPDAALAWWGARAERLLATDTLSSATTKLIIGALIDLGGIESPVPALARATHFGALLAERDGDNLNHERLAASRRSAAETILRHATDELAEAARSTPWLQLTPSAAPRSTPEGLDLGRLCRSLSEREDLEALLHRALEVLLNATSAERGIVLLRSRDGELRARASSNLGKRGLRGEQLELSRSLARRALDTGKHVVATDAVAELSDSHASIHALAIRSVLVLPLSARGEVEGVVYLDDRSRRAVFGEREVTFAQAIAPLVALAIADARTQAALRRAVRRAEIARTRLERSLAERQSALERAEEELERHGGSRRTRYRYDDIIGESETITSLLKLIDRVAPTDVTVLVRGESGTGKELVARALHRNSGRSQRAFVCENCGALPESLLESTLFGHVRGAFTGATESRLGLLEAADGGTLFLDEVAEMSLGMQTKLLRVLEDGEVRPVGSTKSRRVDVRIITATNKDLAQLAQDGRFREDLLYRLEVITLTVPPLRERPTDIPLLVNHILRKHAGKRRITVTAAARRQLASRPWPGNVRQLENELRRALVMCDELLDLEHLSTTPAQETVVPELSLDVRARTDELERRLVKDALHRVTGNRTHAAKLLGLSRFGLLKMMQRLGIEAAKRNR
ncbi:MAG: GAF domain-containing protein [Myxococcales bacterium]|nr:GAF domain-containing protein [Myxococcales bacterium]